MNNSRVRAYRIRRINSQFANRAKEKERSRIRATNDSESDGNDPNFARNLAWGIDGFGGGEWNPLPLSFSVPLLCSWFLWDESRTRLLLSIQWNQINARWRTIYHASNTPAGRKTPWERKRARRPAKFRQTHYSSYAFDRFESTRY